MIFFFRLSHMNSNFTIQNYTASGVGVGLELLFRPEQWTYQSYTEPFFGAVFVAHDSEDFTDMVTDYKYIFPGYVASYTITPTVIESDESVRSMPINKRKCFFSDENPIEFSTKYSAENCLTECRMKTTIRLCQCIPFYYPHAEMPTYKHYRQCDFNDIECLDRNHEEIVNLQTKSMNSYKNLCNCDPSCSKIVN